MNCASCGTSIPESAQFCHKCGTRVGATSVSGWRSGAPWALGGLVAGAIIGAVGMNALRPGTPPPVVDPSAVAAPAPAEAPPDISSMTPEERANRLYNRIMTLHAAGKRDSAEFFLPMALQAYAMLPARNADAHYHLGVLKLTAGDLPAALAEADSIKRQAPTHLFGDMLRARVYGLRRDTKNYREACQSYLKHEAAELAKKLPEYTEHAGTIAGFHEEATGIVAGAPRTGQ